MLDGFVKTGEEEGQKGKQHRETFRIAKLSISVDEPIPRATEQRNLTKFRRGGQAGKGHHSSGRLT